MNKLSDNRRDFLKKLAVLSIAGLKISAAKSTDIIEPVYKQHHETERVNDVTGPFTLPKLPYEYDELEPYIDKMTMQIHHDKHHQAYVDNLNKAVTEAKATDVTLEALCKSASHYSPAIRNNAGGHYNHSMFWTLMKKGGGGAPTGALADAISSTFGSVDDFKTKFNEAGKTRFGSGWAWLVVNEGKLAVGSTPNQDNPLMDVSDVKGTPILGLDVWEHAYYLKYQNKRPDYITAWWNVVNWDEVAKLYSAAK
jgi:Fe-Mn family superoxide dismutase